MNNISSLVNIASIKNQFDEFRAQVYPRNETERKVMNRKYLFKFTGIMHCIYNICIGI